MVAAKNNSVTYQATLKIMCEPLPLCVLCGLIAVFLND